jgi:hypothetical protein
MDQAGGDVTIHPKLKVVPDTTYNIPIGAGGLPGSPGSNSVSWLFMSVNRWDVDFPMGPII